MNLLKILHQIVGHMRKELLAQFFFALSKFTAYISKLYGNVVNLTLLTKTYKM
jgi:hypothetical protein